MPGRRVEIDLTAPTDRIKVDGRPVRGVTGFDVRSVAATRSNTVTLHLLGLEDLVVTLVAEVTLPEKTIAALVALGWSPPPDPGASIAAQVRVPREVLEGPIPPSFIDVVAERYAHPICDLPD